jgi:hypothetical protein
MNTQILSSLAAIDIGTSAEQFFKTDLGRYLLGVSKQESAEYVHELKNVSPVDTKSIMDLQIKIKSTELAITWLKEAILSGEQSEYELKLLESEENNG